MICIQVRSTVSIHNNKKKIKLVPLVEQELFILPKHLSSPLFFSLFLFCSYRVAQFVVFYCVLYIIGSLFCTFSIGGHCITCPTSIGHCITCPTSIGHCITCPTSIHSFWHLLWYLQALLVLYISTYHFMLCWSPHKYAHPLQWIL